MTDAPPDSEPGGPPAAPAPPPRWALRDAAFGLIGALVASNVVIIAWVTVDGGAEIASLPLGALAVAQVGLWAGLLGAPLLASRRLGRGDLRTDFGLVVRRWDLPAGVAAGVGLQLVVIPLLYWPIFKLIGERDLARDAKEIADRANGAATVGFVLAVAVGAPIVEELFFRGLLQQAIAARTGEVTAVFVAATVFGLFHFQVVQLPALVLFGVVAGELTRRTGRLGPAIGTHIGFNATAVALLLIG